MDRNCTNLSIFSICFYFVRFISIRNDQRVSVSMPFLLLLYIFMILNAIALISRLEFGQQQTDNWTKYLGKRTQQIGKFNLNHFWYEYESLRLVWLSIYWILFSLFFFFCLYLRCDLDRTYAERWRIKISWSRMNER